MKNIKNYIKRINENYQTKQALEFLDMFDNKRNSIKDCWKKATNNDPSNIEAIIYGLINLQEENGEDYSFVFTQTIKELVFK